MLQRVRELAVQYKNGTLSSTNQSAIQSEVLQLASEIERLGSSTKFNGISLLNNTATVSFQVGSNDSEQISIAMISLGATVSNQFYQLTTAGTADISEIDAAIDAVSAQRAALGAVQNRLEYSLDNVGIYQENLVAAESRIRDVDRRLVPGGPRRADRSGPGHGPRRAGRAGRLGAGACARRRRRRGRGRRDRPGRRRRGRPGRAAAGLQRLPADRRVPRGDGR